MRASASGVVPRQIRAKGPPRRRRDKRREERERILRERVTYMLWVMATMVD
jgi:hypothetical protein